MAVLAAVSAYVLWDLVDEAELIDLQVYRFGVEAWMNGLDPYGPMPATSVGAQLPYLYPPPSLLVFVPFAVIPLEWSMALTTVVSVAAIVATVYVTLSRCWPRANASEVAVVTLAVLPLMLRLEPVRETLTFGQINLWLLALVALDCMVRKPKWPRGLLIGLAFALKLTPAAFVLFFLVRRDYRALIVSAVSGAAFVGIGFLVSVEASVKYWFSGAGPTSGISGTPFGTNQTILAALARLDMTDKTLHDVLWIGLTAAAVGLAVLAMARLDAPSAMVVNGVLVLLVTPTAWSHHWVWIVPALVVLAYHAGKRLTPVLWTALLAAAVVTTASTVWWDDTIHPWDRPDPWGWAVPLLAVALLLLVTGRFIPAYGTLVLVTFLYGPHQYLWRGSNTEFQWTWYQHLYGSAFVILGLGAIGVAMWKVRARKADPAKETAGETSGPSAVDPAAEPSAQAAQPTPPAQSTQSSEPAP